MGALGCDLKLLLNSDNVQALSPGDLLANYRGPVCVCVCQRGLHWQRGGPAVRSAVQVLRWLRHVSLLLVGLTPHAVCLLCAPSLPLQLKTGCGVHLLVNMGAVKCARTIGRRLVCPVVVGCGFAIVVCMQQHVSVTDMLKCSHSWHPCTRSQVRTRVLLVVSSTPSQDRTGDLQRVRLTS